MSGTDTTGGELLATGAASPEDIMFIKSTKTLMTPTTETPITAGIFQICFGFLLRGLIAG
jgi:hypothetical protein